MPKGIKGRSVCSVEDCDKIVKGYGWLNWSFEATIVTVGVPGVCVHDAAEWPSALA